MLVRRILSAVFLVLPIIAALVFAPRFWATHVALALYVVAAWEWSGFLQNRQPWQRVALLLFYSVLLMLAAWAVRYPEVAFWILLISVIWWLIAFVWILNFPTVIPDILVVLCGALVIVPPLYVLAYQAATGSPLLLIFVFVVVWAADIGAYFTGRAIGRHKLAKKVSPGKTWEGFFGGLVAALLAAFVFGQVTAIAPPLVLFAMALLGAMGSVIGDLTVSMFKRHSGVKDCGVIFPGHGGVMDRFDSFSAAAPVILSVALAHAQMLA